MAAVIDHNARNYYSNIMLSKYQANSANIDSYKTSTYSNKIVNYNCANCMAECFIYKSNRIFIYSNNLSLQQLLDHFPIYRETF